MATKTKDYKVIITDQQNEYTFSAKSKNAIYVKGIKQDDIDTDSFKIVGNNLLFSAKGKDFVVSNYTGIKYIKTDNASGKTDLLDIISHSYVDNTANVISTYNKKLTVTGATNYNDEIDMSSITNLTKTVKIGKKKQIVDKTSQDSGFTIKSGAGDDVVTGSMYSDTITGGIGRNIINYTKGHGNDTIVLTKNEDLTLNIKGLSRDDLSFNVVKNNLVISYTDDNNETQKLTLKNFGTKDVVGGNGKVTLCFDNGDDINLKTDLYLDEIKVTKNYTGTYHSEEINAEDYQLYKTVKVGKTKVKEKNNEVSLKGLTLKGGAGDDTITGTDYSDKIYGNTGTDTINAGTGNNYIYFNKGDGHDIIENGNGIDTLVFAKKTQLSYSYDKYDLIIKYSDNDTVTLKDYLKGHSVQYVQIGKTKTAFNPPQPTVEEYQEDGYTVFDGSEIADTITGTNNNDNIYGNDGNDNIDAKKGADIIDGGAGNNTYTFVSGDGQDTIINGDGNDTIKFPDAQNITYSRILDGNDLIIGYGDNDSITLTDYFVDNSHSTKTILNGTTELNISEEVAKGYNLLGTESAETFDGTLDIPFTYVVNGGNDIIQNSKNTDTIKINTQETLNYSKASNSNDLVVTYGNSSITIKNYFDTENHVQRIINGTTILNIANELDNKLEILIPDNETNITGTTNDDVIHLKDTGVTLFVSEGDGKDIIYSGTDEDTLVINNKTFDDISYVKTGNDLVINYSDNDSVTLKNYFTEEHSVKNITAGDDTQLLADKIKLYFEGTNIGENITGTDYQDIITAKKGNDTIDGGMRNDTYVFNTGDGTDTIINGAGTDTVKFNESQVLKFSHEMKNNDLVILYGNNDKIILQNYYVNNSHSVKNIDNNGTIISVETAIAQYGMSKIYENQSSYNTIEISSYSFDDISYTRNSNDLLINWGTNDEILLKDYFNNNYTDNNHTIRNIIANGEEDLLSNRVILYIDGTDLSETINGTIYTDVINAKKGNDTIDGKQGNDTYIFVSGDGKDTIVNGQGNDSIKFNTNLDLRFSHNLQNKDLVMAYSNNDTITLQNYYVNNSHSVKTIINGTETLTVEEALNIYGIDITGTLNSENITGTSANDTIIGGKGADIIDGGSGNNTYVFNTGDGADTIINGTGVDTIKFNITQTLTYTHDLANDDLVIRYGNSDSIILKDYFKTNSHSVGTIINNTQSLDLITELSKGMTIIGTSSGESIDGTIGDDIIRSNGGADIITGNKGTDKLYSGSGNSTYIFSIGNGKDEIYSGTGQDTIVINNVTFDDLIYEKSNNDLIINYSNEDSITLKNYFITTHSVKNITVAGDTELLAGKIKLTFNGTNASETITGTDYDDIITANQGNDTINGSLGNNLYVFNQNDGRDTIIKGNGTDTIKFNQTENIRFSRDFSNNDLVLKYGNNDTITLQNYYDNNSHSVKTIINGTETFTVTEALNTYGIDITGTSGNNNITGTSANDTINAGQGLDTIDGGSGNNTYLFTAGDGTDTIINGTGVDTIKFNTAQTLSYTEDISNNNLIISYGNNDTITLQNYFVGDNPSVKTIQNGTKTLTIADEILKGMTFIGSSSADTINGTDYSDVIRSIAGNDTITANKGNDELYSGSGNSIYIFNLGDGADNIYSGSGEDTIEINGVTFDNLSYTKDNNNLIINYSNSDSIKLIDFFSSTHSVKNIKIGDTIDLLDNRIKDLVINGTNNAETVNGTKYDDIITPNGGNDTINGGLGNNTYVFKIGDGTNSIVKGTGTDKVVLPNNSTIKLSRSMSNQDLTINYGTNSNVVLKDYFVNSNHSVKSIVINDTEKTLANFIAENGIEYTGTNSGETINGSSGNDTITGGKGNDTLNGSAGNDFYVFASGDGTDTINATVGEDTIWFKTQVSNIGYTKSSNNQDLILTYGNNDSITIKGYFTGTSSIKNIKNGNTLSTIENSIAQFGLNIMGTDSDDNITGTNNKDIIDGRKGTDIIYGGAGDDTIYGGSNDTGTVYGVPGNDTIYGEDGNDYIETSKGYTYKDVFGTTQTLYSNNYVDGGSGNDTIVCYNGNNTVIGGGGNDTITVGIGTNDINSGDGNDIITAGSGTNNITGGTGTDKITVGNGTNTLNFVSGDGNDTIYGGTKSDIIKISDYDLNDLKYEKSGNNLIIKYGNDYSDSITLDKFFNSTNNNRNLIGKNDTNSTIQDNATIYTTISKGGTYLNDIYTITASDLTPTITSTGGCDTLYFENTIMSDIEYRISGNDLYIGFNKVDGSVRNWTILKNYMIDTNHSVKYIKSSDSKTINIEDIILTQGFINSNSIITGTRLNDRITADSSITTVNGGAGNDIITGNNNGDLITINGGSGNDTIISASTPVNYIFNSGDGNDIVYNCKSTDVLKFNGIDLDTLTWNKDNEDLVIGYGNNDTVTLKDYFLTALNIKLNGANNSESYIYNKFLMNPNDNELLARPKDAIWLNDNMPNLPYSFNIVQQGFSDENSITVKLLNGKTLTGIIFWMYMTADTAERDRYLLFKTKSDSDYKFSYSCPEGIVSNYGTNLSYNIIVSPKQYNSDIYSVYKSSNTTTIYGQYTQAYNGDLRPTHKTISVVVKSWSSTELYGGTTNNILNGNGFKTIVGDKGNDYLYGGYGSTFKFYAGDGNDILYTYSSADKLSFDKSDFAWEKANDDLIIKYNNSTDSLTIKNYFSSTDKIATINNSTIDASINNLKINGNANEINNITGTKYSDIIYGGNEGDTLRGVSGDDTVYGGAGDDFITGGNGNDTIYGEIGDDYMEGNAGANILYGGSGNDTYAPYKLEDFDTIYDESGESDLIKIRWSNKDDLIVSFDLQIDSDGNILDYLSKNMYVQKVTDFGNSEIGVKVIDQFVAGHSIDKITSADGCYLTTTQINQLRSDVAGWLHDNGFESVQQILDSQNEADIANLIAEFQKANWQQA